MNKFMLTNKNVFSAVLFYVILMVSHCESNRNINGDYPTQQHRPRDLDPYTYQHQEENPYPSSTSPPGPRRIGLDVNGRVKSLLWRNSKTSNESALTPLFSSSREYEDEEDGLRLDSNGPVPRVDEAVDSKRNKEKPRGLASLILPGAVYGTADYRFRKERWWGVEKIGMIFRWNVPRPSSQQGNDKNDVGESKALLRKKLISSGSPTKLDISVHRSIFSPSLTNQNKVFTSLVDSGNVRIGWQQNDDGDIIGVGESNPWIQVGFDSKHSPSDGDFLDMKSSDQSKNPFHLCFFLPLVRRRFDLQWTSRWSNLLTTRKESGAANQWASKHRQPNEDPWWIPQVSLDPSTGTLSSKNRYRDAFSGNDNRQYFTEFKLRIRTTIPTLLSSVATTAMGTSDDDDDLQTASLRLECSLISDPMERRRPSLGPTCTTARFETIIIPSFWFRSVTETARFGLIHEQNHATDS